MTIRETGTADRAHILALHRAAFGEEEGTAIADLVAALLDDPTAQPQLSLIAEHDGRPAGHVLYTPVTVAGAEGNGGYILCPLAVHPDRQRSGTGSALMERGLALLKERGARHVLVLGDPDYYRRAGFHTNHYIKPPYDIPYPEAWQAQALVDGALSNLNGTVRCADALHVPEHW